MPRLVEEQRLGRLSLQSYLKPFTEERLNYTTSFFRSLVRLPFVFVGATIGAASVATFVLADTPS